MCVLQINIYIIIIRCFQKFLHTGNIRLLRFSECFVYPGGTILRTDKFL